MMVSYLTRVKWPWADWRRTAVVGAFDPGGDGDPQLLRVSRRRRSRTFFLSRAKKDQPQRQWRTFSVYGFVGVFVAQHNP
jgi:hypothetical protein